MQSIIYSLVTHSAWNKQTKTLDMAPVRLSRLLPCILSVNFTDSELIL